MLLCKSLLLGGEWLHILSPPNLLSSQALLRTCSIQVQSDSELFTNLIFINPRLTHVLDAAFKKLNKLLSSIDLREKNMIILLGRHVPFALLFIIRFT